MIVAIKIKSKIINVKSIKETISQRGSKTLCINDEYNLKKSDNIIFKCSECGKEHEQQFRFKLKFFSNEIMCDSCSRSIHNAFRRDDIKEKIKQTNLKRYGVENPHQSKIIIDKTKQTQIERYGALGFNTEKQKDTLEKRYGSKVMFKTNHFKKKAGDTLEKKYGVRNPMQAPEIRDKVKKTMIKKYGAECFFTTEKYAEMDIDPEKSKTENEIANYVRSLIKNIEQNNRVILQGKELDIYIPSKNLAIEFDGLYWHSDKFKNKNYHLDKTLKCEEQGIQLIHVFEDEWKYKQNIVKARLKNILGFNNRRIGARKTTIKEISPKIKNEFLNKYHLQGADKSNIKLGAYYKNELIGVMTFSKPRIFMGKKQKYGYWELSRFATISDTYTPGLASKMLKHFERSWDPKVIESFADRRWSQGSLYEMLGFEMVSQTSPNYWYSRGQIKYHRYNFRKSELTKFDNYSVDKTEKQIMDEAGWLRIYDCGSYKYIKSN